MSRINIKNIYLFGIILTLTLAKNTLAIGIGTTITTLVDTNGSLSNETIYIPIKTSETFLVEPFLSREKTEDNDSFGGGKSTSTNLTIGVGLFVNSPINQDLSRYFGLRVARITNKSSNNLSSNKTTSTAITPIFGLDYSISNNVFIALEAGISIVDEKDSNNPLNDGSTESTFSQLVARYYF